MQKPLPMCVAIGEGLLHPRKRDCGTQKEAPWRALDLETIDSRATCAGLTRLPRRARAPAYHPAAWGYHRSLAYPSGATPSELLSRRLASPTSPRLPGLF